MMSQPCCRLLPYASADGPHNMAADEVLLEAAVAGHALLRFYGWSQATVSLGYFQPAELLAGSADQDLHLARLPFVRRPSGGAALVHDHEVTYALGLPAGKPWQTGESWLCRMHGIIAAALANLGVDVPACRNPDDARFTGLLCFQHLTAGDLLLGSAKVAGSAQRRQRGAWMQHGAILLAASPHAPILPGIRELCGRTLSIHETCAAVAAAFAHHTGWELTATDWTTAEQQRIEELVATKYKQDAWNRRR